ncbi:MAG: hypothetical protein AAGG07_09440 [Planctomycetota bacterium]
MRRIIALFAAFRALVVVTVSLYLFGDLIDPLGSDGKGAGLPIGMWVLSAPIPLLLLARAWSTAQRPFRGRLGSTVAGAIIGAAVLWTAFLITTCGGESLPDSYFNENGGFGAWFYIALLAPWSLLLLAVVLRPP